MNAHQVIEREPAWREDGQGAARQRQVPVLAECPERGELQGTRIGGEDSPNARAANSLSFCWEPFPAIAPELPPLFLRHWREVALNQDEIKLDPLWDTYARLAMAGVLRVLTARAEGVLVGYHFILVLPHLHYGGILAGETDMFWLDPAYRGGLAGYRLLRLARDDLKATGVKWHKVSVKRHKPLGPLMKRLGYTPIETVYSKVF